jgi:dihydrofolate reductase
MKAIFAIDAAGGIGKQGTLPWPKNKQDFAWFKEHTLGQTIVMGRRTWDDPAFPKPLPNRTNIVITSSPIDIDGVTVVQSIHDVPADAVVIGGAGLIQTVIDRVDTIYLTRFPDDYECDVKLDIDAILENFTVVEGLVGKNIIFEIWKRCNNT